MTRKNRRAVTGNAIVPGMRVTLPFGELKMTDDLGYVDYAPVAEVEVIEVWEADQQIIAADTDYPTREGIVYINPDDVYSVR